MSPIGTDSGESLWAGNLGKWDRAQFYSLFRSKKFQSFSTGHIWTARSGRMPSSDSMRNESPPTIRTTLRITGPIHQISVTQTRALARSGPVKHARVDPTEADYAWPEIQQPARQFGPKTDGTRAVGRSEPQSRKWRKGS